MHFLMEKLKKRRWSNLGKILGQFMGRFTPKRVLLLNAQEPIPSLRQQWSGWVWSEN